MDIFSILIRDKILLYAPLQHFLALVNQQAVEEIHRNLLDPLSSSGFIRSIKTPCGFEQVSHDETLKPLFLGIIPTRNCNLYCQYCDFAASKQSNPIMGLSLARDTINAYLLVQKSIGVSRAEIQFFGGEPFYAKDVVIFSVEYATTRAAELGLQVHFEVTTNGVYGSDLSRWIAGNFNAVVLSLDGPKDIQDNQRPGRNGKSTFNLVFDTAKLISLGRAELILRACITKQTVNRMREISQWFCEEFSPSTVCFETMVPSDLSESARLEPPDPWEFAVNFHLASEYLAEHQIMAIHSTAETHTCRTSFCPLGKDALIVSPDGSIDACYLLPESWKRRGFDLHLGHMDGGTIKISSRALNHVRSLTVVNRPLCADCFCRYHCAGGCYVNHDTSSPPGQFDALCIQTRILTIIGLLKRLGQDELIGEWMADRTQMEASVWQKTDRLCNDEALL
jgi:uncharacterized protein